MMIMMMSSIKKMMMLISAGSSIYNLDGLEHDTFYHVRARYNHIQPHIHHHPVYHHHNFFNSNQKVTEQGRAERCKQHNLPAHHRWRRSPFLNILNNNHPHISHISYPSISAKLMSQKLHFCLWSQGVHLKGPKAHTCWKKCTAFLCHIPSFGVKWTIDIENDIKICFDDVVPDRLAKCDISNFRDHS